ncbi:CRTAC1 family protein, partial [Pseudorhodobacter sp.]|uniref:CRTAC1 family protein n=1 Tax=Pseudorhodobacter sp. TaxID=1934400 RepID=UPI002648914B
DETAQWGLQTGDRWSTAFTATWEVGQDWPTLAIGHYVDRSRADGPFEACDSNSLYRPQGAGYGPVIDISPGYCALSMLFSDWQRNGVADLRISNDRHYYVRGGYEEMWHLNPLAPYDKADWPRISLWGMGIASRDITGDGLPEVMMTSMGDQLLQINRGAGRMENAPYSIGTFAQHPYSGDDGRPSTGWHAEFGDIDNDGRDDLFIAKGNVDQMPSNAMHDPNNLLMQGADGVFAERGGEAGIGTTLRSRGAGLADLNADGLLDIVVVNRRAPMEIWQNVTSGTGHWLAVELHGRGGNSQAVGAWVEVRANGRVQSREVTVGGGHVSGQSLPLHFGLGAATSADLRVIWPGGEVTDWAPVIADRMVALAQD